jgi:aminoglycoside phosphotransferase (APT) family kinase protein
MRLGWTRSLPVLAPTADEVQAMVRSGLPDARIADFSNLEGGFANTNICVDLDNGRVLLRLYQRDASQAAKEAAIAELLAPTVPVARTLHIGRHGKFRFALVEWVEGPRLEIAIQTMTPQERRASGFAVGTALGAIHSIAFDQVGFIDADFKITYAFPEGGEFLLDFLRGSFIEGQANALLGRELVRAAMDYAAANKEHKWGGTPCLVHSDFNGSNILMRGTDIAAIIDWEFGMAGRPDVDFGNLLRNHPDEIFLDGVVEAYRATGRHLPQAWRKLARLSDLVAWADILSRPGIHQSIVETAKTAIAETLASD